MQPQNKKYDLDSAFNYCASVTEANYENFPVASFFLPREKRPYIQAIYAFSRMADDIADESGMEGEERLEKLNDWEQMLQKCYENEAEHPVFIALQETVRRLDIPIEPLRDLLTAFKRDVVQNRYATFEDLLSYCKCSANPVGRLVLLVFNYREQELFELSDHICTALQLTNFWQDVMIDREKDRLYVPLEDLDRYGYSEESWRRGISDERLKNIIRFEVERTRDIFYKGSTLPSVVSKDLQLELKLIWLGGMSILRRISKDNYDVITQRPSLNTFDKIMILVKGFLINDLQYYQRKRPRKELWDLT